MRVYLELVEQAVDGDFIRVDVTDWPAEDIEKVKQCLIELAQTYSIAYIQLHYCEHDTDGVCHVEEVYRSEMHEP